MRRDECPKVLNFGVGEALNGCSLHQSIGVENLVNYLIKFLFATTHIGGRFFHLLMFFNNDQTLLSKAQSESVSRKNRNIEIKTTFMLNMFYFENEHERSFWPIF